MAAVSGDSWSGRGLLVTQRLRQRRVELGLTQKQVVTRLIRCGVRTTNRALSSLEHGAGVDVARLPELAAALDCTVTYLVGLTGDPHRWEPDPALAVHPSAERRGAAPPATDPPVVSAGPEQRESLLLGAFVPQRPSRR